MLRQDNRCRGFSLTEILPVALIVLIGIAVALPSCLQPHMVPHELCAIKAFQTIHQAEMQYKSQFGGYANTLKQLGPPVIGPAARSAADLIGNDLSNGEKCGYRFTLTGSGGGYVLPPAAPK
jgi:hypothetical protein